MKKTIIAIILCLVILIPATMIFAENPEVKKALVNTLKCTGCGDCVKTCPTKAISIVNNKAIIDPEKCINCLLCVKSCDYKAIAASRELK